MMDHEENQSHIHCCRNFADIRGQLLRWNRSSTAIHCATRHYRTPDFRTSGSYCAWCNCSTHYDNFSAGHCRTFSKYH
jgi:hypothetical protein